MTPNLPEDLRELVELLNKKQVQFVVVGSHSLAFHGHPRELGDLDLYIESSTENIERLIAALVEFGFEEPELRAHHWSNAETLITVDIPPHSVDFHNALKVVSFAEAWEARVSGLLADQSVFFLSKELLIKDKQAAKRTKDLADLAMLLEAAPAG